jgi:hypothetical protein
VFISKQNKVPFVLVCRKCVNPASKHLFWLLVAFISKQNKYPFWLLVEFINKYPFWLLVEFINKYPFWLLVESACKQNLIPFILFVGSV